MTLPTLLFANLAAIMVAALLLWLISIPLRNVSIVDIFWGSCLAPGWRLGRVVGGVNVL